MAEESRTKCIKAVIPCGVGRLGLTPMSELPVGFSKLCLLRVGKT